MKGNILIIDDDRDVVLALQYLLKTKGYKTQSANSPAQALDKLNTRMYDLLLIDLNYTNDTTSGREGLELVSKIKDRGYQGQIVIMTAWGSVELAVEAMRRGAHDFIQKPWDNERVISIIRNQMLLGDARQKTFALEEKNRLLKQQLNVGIPHIVAESSEMKEFLVKVDKVAQSDVPVLLTGENGAGKSLIAERIHALSKRREHDMISVNMGSISEYLFESEMFGHIKGAFTDARENRVGRFELANDGTLFLDEIGNTPYTHQAKLLRVLESSKFERAGSSETRISDCRVISATNCDLDAAVSEGAFRRDLLYRINTITLRVPALRERKEDIKPLVNSYLEVFRNKYENRKIIISDEALSALIDYDWPGNVRELSHAIERSVVLCRTDEITLSDTGVFDGKAKSRNSGPVIGSDTVRLPLDKDQLRKETLKVIEQSIIMDRLDQYSGNAANAAKSLGLSKSAIYRRLAKQQSQD